MGGARRTPNREYAAVPTTTAAVCADDDEVVLIAHASPVLSNHHGDEEDALAAPMELVYDEAAFHRYRIVNTYVLPFIMLTSLLGPLAFITMLNNRNSLVVGTWIAFMLVAVYVWCGFAERHLMRGIPYHVAPRTVLHATALEHQQPPSRRQLSGRVSIPYTCIDKIDISTVPNYPVSVVTITTTPGADESRWVLNGMPKWSSQSPTKGKRLTIKGLADPYLLKREVMQRKQQHQGDIELSDPESLVHAGGELSAGLPPMDKVML